MDTKQSLAALIAETIENCYLGIDGLPTADDIAGFLEIPPQKEMGDYALPCFKLAKLLRKSPVMIAEGLETDEIQALVSTLPEVAPLLEGKSVKKCIIVKGRLVNLIVG